MLDLSCSDYTFPLLSRRHALSLIRLLEFEFVDIGLFERNPGFQPSQMAASPHVFAEGVCNDLAQARLRAADVFLQVGTEPAQYSINDSDSRVRQIARESFLLALDLCTKIDCTHLTSLPGMDHGDPAGDLERSAEELAWRVGRASAAGVVCSIEPHTGSICGTTQATHTLLALIPSLTLTLDYGHFIFQGETNEATHSLLPHASHLHLRGGAPGRLQTPVAESTIDLQHIVGNLQRNGYRGRCALEYVWSEWHDCNRTDNLSETILLRRELLRAYTELTKGEPQHV